MRFSIRGAITLDTVPIADSEASISPAIAAVAVVPVAIIGVVIAVVGLVVVYSCYRKQRYISKWCIYRLEHLALYFSSHG